MKNSIFNIESKYNLEINNEQISQFKDVNILKKGLGKRFNYNNKWNKKRIIYSFSFKNK